MCLDVYIILWVHSCVSIKSFPSYENNYKHICMYYAHVCKCVHIQYTHIP